MNDHERLTAPFHRGRSDLELWRRHLTPDDIFPHRTGRECDLNGYRYASASQWHGSPLDLAQTERWLEEHERRLRHGWTAQLESLRQTNARVDEQMAALSRDPSAPPADWVRLILAYDRAEMDMQAAVWYAPQWLIFTCESLLRRFICDVMPDCGMPDLLPSLLQGLSCYSVERTIAAQALGREIQEDAVRATFGERPLGMIVPFLLQRHPECRFLADLAAFCRRFGMEMPALSGEQSARGLDLGGVLLAIRAAVLGQGIDAATVLEQAAGRRESAEVQAREWLAAHRTEHVERFDRLLDWAQFWTPALDNRKWNGTMYVRRRELRQRTGEALFGAGLINEPDHFLLLTQEDWAEYVERPDPAALRRRYQERLLEYERDRRLEPPPLLGKPPLAEDDEPVAERPATRDDGPRTQGPIFHGEGIAPGKARGIAHIVADLDDMAWADKLTGDDILICGRDSYNAQWRRDWYSVFMVARGLVTAGGAQLHHATQIARECGVPFVNLPADDLAALRAGMTVEIDGQAGALTVLS